MDKKIEILFHQKTKDILNTKPQLSKFFKSNMSSVIDRMEMQEAFIKSVKVFNEKKGNNANGYKARRTNAYWQKETARQRRKQGKTRYDTYRREEQPDAEDLWLEDHHFANFLGLSTCEWGKGNILMTYNGGTYSEEYNIDKPVNITECDKYLKLEQRIREEEQMKQEEQQFTAGKCNCQGYCELDHTTICYCHLVACCSRGDNCHYRHVPKEEITKYLTFYSEDDESLIGSEDEAWGREDEDEEEAVHEPLPLVTNWKDYHTKWPAAEWEDNLKFNEERNKKEQQLFVQQNPDVGRFTVDCLLSAK